MKVQTLLDRPSKSTQVPNFVKICPVGAEIFCKVVDETSIQKDEIFSALFLVRWWTKPVSKMTRYLVIFFCKVVDKTSIQNDEIFSDLFL